MRKTRLAVAAGAVGALLIGVCAPGGGFAAAQGSPDAATRLARRVCETVDHELLRRVFLGSRLDRSGQIQYLPEEPNYAGAGLPHAGPWGYVQDVPLFLYGPGYVRPGSYRTPVTLADIAPTQGELVGFDGFRAPDGRALDEAVTPRAAGTPPRLVVTMVWDSAGIDVLERWPKTWPYLKSLQPDGAWFTNATAGASPSNTPVSHATIGTGAFPDVHGFTDEYIWINDKLQKPNENGPGFLLVPTFADVYDRAMDNEPLVGGIATLSAHIMMMSHGSMWGGGDQDLAITREKEDAATGGAESISWGMTGDMAPYYKLPTYANRTGSLEKWARQLDQRDGKLDGNWRSNSIAQYNNGFDTPARTPYQGEIVKAVIDQEGFGKDATPDLLSINYKAIDSVGHIWSADGIEMSDTVAIQDEELRSFVEYLDGKVGKKRWVLILTADHGTNRDPAVTGAFQIDMDRLEAQINERFGEGESIVEKTRPTQIWFDLAAIDRLGVSLVEVSEFIVSLTQSDTVKAGVAVQPGKADERVMTGAWPTSLFSEMPCLPQAREPS